MTHKSKVNGGEATAAQRLSRQRDLFVIDSDIDTVIIRPMVTAR